MKKKTMAMLISLVFILVCAVGGTLAWLTAQTDTVTNTFNGSDIDITLVETLNPDGTKNKDDAPVTDWNADMIPGFTYSKNPTVSVDADSVDCYLFVKFEEKNNASEYLTYTSTLTVANGWTKLDGENDVWYRVVKTTDATKSWGLLDDNQVIVKDSVTKQNMSNAAKAELVYTAYASQLYKSNTAIFTPAEAWAKAKPAE